MPNLSELHTKVSIQTHNRPSKIPLLSGSASPARTGPHNLFPLPTRVPLSFWGWLRALLPLVRQACGHAGHCLLHLKRRLTTRRALTLLLCGQSALAGMVALGVIPGLFLGVLALSGAAMALSLALHRGESPVVDPVHPPDLEALVQARTAQLLATNAQLAAEIAACKKAAAKVASQYAHILKQAKEIAAAEERARLARDLHDSVTQTLYSASLIVQILPMVWQRSPDEGARNLNKLRQLVRGALAEMRTLLFELRPAALDTAELGVLLQQLGDVLTGHTQIPVTITIEGETEPPTAVRIVVYRIAQEALNNIGKHANATQVDVTLCQEFGAVRLQIDDNGRGFDANDISGGHMGLRIMAERAADIHAHFDITSVPGDGTKVWMCWTDPSVNTAR